MFSPYTFTEGRQAGVARLAALVLCLLTMTVVWLWPAQADAQSLLERLVMPGPLTAPHAKFEPECDNCHLSFSQGAQSELCLDCHKETAADVAAGSGYHGRASEVQAFGCNHCHTDHEGLDFQIVNFDTEMFDHRLTDFTLSGAHLAAPCSACHAGDKPFRTAPAACIDCHRDDEPHRGAVGTECERCHSETAWSDVKPFDHSKTEFPLKGGHVETACSSCHRGEVYKGLPMTCSGCHRLQDVHQDRFGTKCESCHDETGWTHVRFDHDKDTEFTLTGQHREANCNDCHQGSIETAAPGKACTDCHAADDPHGGALGSDCAQCHSTSDWRQDVAFDHDITNFPLIGLHVLATCEQCHLDSTFHRVKPDCASCHGTDDSHKGTLGPNCASCHTPNGWAFWLFDHDRQTDFTLTGKHAGLVCNACHVENSAADQLKRNCIACHRQDDVHRSGFGPDCAACHSTESFKGARLR